MPAAAAAAIVAVILCSPPYTITAVTCTVASQQAALVNRARESVQCHDSTFELLGLCCDRH
jgi:hypothetical protein